MKIALVQKKAIPNNKNRNMELALQYIKEASGRGADIVLFPEMWSNGYAAPFDGAFDNPTDPAFEEERKKWLESGVTIESDYVATIKDAAAKYKIGVCATFLSKTDRYAYKKIMNYSYNFGFSVNFGEELLDFFEESSSSGRPVLEVIGPDAASFCDELMRNTNSQREDSREKLNREVADYFRKKER